MSNVQCLMSNGGEAIPKIALIGGGAWGTTLAILLAQGGSDVFIWANEVDVVDDINTLRENKKYLNGFPLPANISASASFGEAISGANYLLYSVPTQFMAKVVKESAHFFAGEAIISVAKGIEIKSLLLPTQIIKHETSKPVVVLSGPNIAKEIAQGLPAAAVVAGDPAFTVGVQNLFSKLTNFRVYTNDDPLGVEVGGALKNIIAIAAGAVDGMELGDNAKSALMVRGLAEIRRLGVILGGKSETFAGLSGLGDLITTCNSKMSRNHTVGFRLAKGEKVKDILSSTNQVAEGVATTEAVMKLKSKCNIEMPITEELYKVLFCDKRIDEALLSLMTRPLKGED